MKRGAIFRSLQKRFRSGRFVMVEKIIRDILKVKDEVTILDCGGRADYWEYLPEDLRTRTLITILNFRSELDLYQTAQSDLRVIEVEGDACNMPQYTDKAFDLVHSNSVIEHVGSYKNMRKFADETRRVGVGYYMQTPNFWFPVDPHYAVPFFHWLPDCTRAHLFTVVNVGYARKCEFNDALEWVDGTKIISSGTVRKLFPDAAIRKERILGLAKSTMAIRM